MESNEKSHHLFDTFSSSDRATLGWSPRKPPDQIPPPKDKVQKYNNMQEKLSNTKYKMKVGATEKPKSQPLKTMTGKET
jgi:hypothetical protein